MSIFEFDFSEFDELVKKFEELGLSEQEISQKVLDSCENEAKEAYRRNVPYDENNTHGNHARDDVNISKMGKSKNGNYYKTVGAGTPKGNKIDTSEHQYLFYIENGTSKMVAKPFMDKASADVASATLPKMKQALENELKERLGD